MRKLLLLETLVTPQIITVVYWIALVMIVVGGISVMFSGGAGGTVTASSFMQGAGGIVFGVIAARVYCELTVIFFRINEGIQHLRDRT